MQDHDALRNILFSGITIGLKQGKVDVVGILDVMEKKEKKTKLKGMVMVELDYDNREDITPLSLATISRNYLVKNGVAFRKV